MHLKVVYCLVKTFRIKNRMRSANSDKMHLWSYFMMIFI